MSDETQLERRARMLGEAIKARVNLIANAISPPGKRPSFTTQLTEEQAYQFWAEHRFDEIGAKALAYMKPEAILELDLALSKRNQAEQFGTQSFDDDTAEGPIE